MTSSGFAMHSDDGEGHTIAWVFCGACARHVEICQCPLPVEPAYITRMRENAVFGTPVHGTSIRRAPQIFSGSRPEAGPSPAPSLDLADLVDQELVDRVKAAAAEADA